MKQIDYISLKRHYELKFRQHGDTHKGVDWPVEKDALTRYDVMLDLLTHNVKALPNIPVVLDFGCGLSHLYDHIQKKNISLDYIGCDISDIFIKTSQTKFPHLKYIQADICKEPEKIPCVDYTVMNGLFTEKINLNYNSMWNWTQEVLKVISSKTRHGIACNFMSKNVDWERDDLFHLSKDTLTGFITKHISRNFIIRNNYGLYEYTVYIYK